MKQDLQILFSPPILIALAVGLGFQVFYLATSHQMFVVHFEDLGDMVVYDEIAMNLRQGKGYCSYTSELEGYFAFRPPLYPIFLFILYSIFGHSFLAVKIVQILLGCGCITLGALIAYQLDGHASSFLAAFLMALFLEQGIMSASLLTEILFTFLFLAGLWMFVKALGTPGYKYWSITGLFWGAGALVKPYLLPLAFLLGVVAVLVERKRLTCKEPLILAISCLLIILPWTVRNYLKLNAFVLISTNGGPNFWVGNNPYANGTDYWPREYYRATLGQIRDEVERQRVAYRQALKFIIGSPTRFLSLGIEKLKFFFETDRIVFYAEPLWGSIWGRILPSWYNWLVLILGGFMGLVSLRRWKFYWPYFTVFLFFVALHFSMFATPRMRYPLMPIFMLFIAGGVRNKG